jgi:NAD(P)-dependent dehydrogenase (short-subunit alcohol dehydrogenase family)
MADTGGIVVTGGLRRLGLAIGDELAAAGYQPIAGSRGSDPPLDLEDPGSIESFSAVLRDRGTVLAGLVNNVALFEADDLFSLEPDRFERHQRVNVLGPLLLIRALQPLIQGGGAIVNVLDHNIENPNIDFLSYKLSKFAMAGATRILARQLAPRIRVNGVAPGLTLPSPLQSEAEFAAIHDSVPLGRGARPEDIAGAVRYLVEARAVTGQILFVDGGERLLARRRDVSFIAEDHDAVPDEHGDTRA